MATKPQLQAKGQELMTRLDEFSKREDWDTVEAKTAAFETLDAEFKAWENDVQTSESASAMAAKLEGFGDVKDVKGNSLPKFEISHPFDRASRSALASKVLTAGPEVEKVLSVRDFRKMFDVVLDEADTAPILGTKDSTEGNNLMGDFVYGTTGPTAIGQAPFGTGAFAPGILPDWRPGIVEQLFFQLAIADLIPSFATTSPNISYLTESLFNSQANATAEVALYPFSSVEVSRAYAQVGKIANALTISDEAIADAPTLWNFVQGRLLLSLQRQEEVQILAGAYPGVGGLRTFAGNFTASSASSIYGATSATGTNVAFPAAGTNGAGVQSQTIASLAYGRKITGPTGSGKYADPLTVSLQLKDAFVDIELAVFQSPTAVIMNPRDWQRLETAQDANSQFMNTSMFGNVYGVSRGPVKSLWGVPVVTTPLFPVGTYLTGWFDAQSIQIARRQGVSMQMTNANGTDFVNGKVTARAEERLGLLVYRPTAFELIQSVTG